MIACNETEVQDAAARLLDFGLLYAEVWAQPVTSEELEALRQAALDASDELLALVDGDTAVGVAALIAAHN